MQVFFPLPKNSMSKDPSCSADPSALHTRNDRIEIIIIYVDIHDQSGLLKSVRIHFANGSDGRSFFVNIHSHSS